MPTALCLLLAIAAPPLAAQSLLDRGPNVDGPWAIPIGVVQFNFGHRFSSSPAPARKITSYPTFTLATALPANISTGFEYSTNSTLVARYPNEWEFFGRIMPLSESRGAELDAALELSWNLAARGPAAELSLAHRFGPLRAIAVGRYLADPLHTGANTALGAALALGLTQHLAIAADATALLHRKDGERVAWSAGLQVALPSTPHTLSLLLSNTAGTTVQSSSVGSSDVRFGFVFTIPITVARYLDRSQASSPAAASTDSVVAIHIKDLKFTPDLLRIRVGTVVEWINADPLVHTVTANDSSFASGPIEPGARWRHRFTVADSVQYSCTPHPFMHATLRIEAAP